MPSTRHSAQRLSVKLARGGRERYFVDGRSIAVDDDSFLILNDNRTYASRFESNVELESFSIFFRPGMAEEVYGALMTPDRAGVGGRRRGRPAAVRVRARRCTRTIPSSRPCCATSTTA